jgi:branched-chain amino acid transport system ATP-binding protein
MLLNVEDIRVHYGKVEAVKGVSLQVMEGDIVTILGANGAGKTTLLSAISGLKHASTGAIWFSGERIEKLRPWELVKLGISHVPEDRGLFPYMTVEDNLLMGAYVKRSKAEKRRDLREVYARFPRLEERKRQKAYSMSGGEQQMVAMGRALMSKPKLLLLDEPSLGLSPIMVDEIASLITKVRDDGVSVLLVEQNAAIALDIAKRGYVMEIGRIILEGESAELVRDERVRRAYLGA